jgi:hypothetical protein
MPLCEFCKKSGIPTNLQSDTRNRHQPNFLALQQSGKTCQLCRLYLNHIYRQGQSENLMQRAQNGDYTTVIIEDCPEARFDCGTRHLEISTSNNVVVTETLVTCTEQSGYVLDRLLRLGFLAISRQKPFEFSQLFIQAYLLIPFLSFTETIC